MDNEAVMLDQDVYSLLVGAAVLYAVTWLNTIVPSSTEVDNPWAKAALRGWEMLSANVLRSAPASKPTEEEPKP